MPRMQQLSLVGGFRNVFGALGIGRENPVHIRSVKPDLRKFGDNEWLERIHIYAAGEKAVVLQAVVSAKQPVVAGIRLGFVHLVHGPFQRKPDPVVELFFLE